jgi:hypothetical protein
MIPAFTESGVLPPGVHPATLAEIAERFGKSSEVRRAQMESVCWMVDLAKTAGVQRIVLNDSFATDIMEPNDVDCVLLLGPDFPKDEAAEAELVRGLPFLEIQLSDQSDFDYFVNRFFVFDRLFEAKGMIEVIL